MLLIHYFKRTCFLKYLKMFELRAAPTYPSNASGSCRNLISNGISPSFPRSIVWILSCFCQSQILRLLPYKPVWYTLLNLANNSSNFNLPKLNQTRKFRCKQPRTDSDRGHLKLNIRSDFWSCKKSGTFCF